MTVIDWYSTAAEDKRIKPLWWQEKGLSFTASGYGKRIPTTRQIRLHGRWRRIYCCCFSNSGTCYVENKNANGEKYWIVIV